MDFKELNNQITAYFTKLQAQISKIVQFVIWRLKNYGQMTVAEQVAYPCVLLGVTLIFTSLILALL
ncbi:hypothetical protein CL619_00750 [archaeon]|nr:hypothetical protein [archaeon]|tara:strand:- start:1791 stop:1988 length:198 start_codon:yes stop_codon:yes gene_type:complete